VLHSVTFPQPSNADFGAIVRGINNSPRMYYPRICLSPRWMSVNLPACCARIVLYTQGLGDTWGMTWLGNDTQSRRLQWYPPISFLAVAGN